MERFIGIDVHKDSSTVAVMGPSGKKIRCDVVETNGAVLVEMMKQIPGKRMLVEMLVQQLDVLETLADSAEKRVEEEAGAHRAVARLKTAPGFGPIRAALS